MAKDDDWGDDWGDVESVPEKSQVPKLLFCGLGCFLPILLMIVVFAFIGSSIQRGRDATRQWAELQARLPHTERPEGWRLLFGFQPGGISWMVSEEVFVFTDAPEGEDMGSGRLVILIWTDDDLTEMFDTSLDGVSPYRVPPAPPPDEPASDESASDESEGDDPDASTTGETAEAPVEEGDPDPVAPEPERETLETIEVQGRAYPIVLLEGDQGGSGWFPFGQNETGEVGPAVGIDLTPTGATRKLVLIGQSNAKEPMDVESLRAFLAAFDLGEPDEGR